MERLEPGRRSVEPREVFINAFNYLALLDSPNVVGELAPDMTALAVLDRTGVIVTAPGDRGYDFTGRYFVPAKGIPEDSVTGGAHCMLVPFWAPRLGKAVFLARQASRRGGDCLSAGRRSRGAGTRLRLLPRRPRRDLTPIAGTSCAG